MLSCPFAGSSSSDVLTSKDISASQSDITSIIHQTNHSNFIDMRSFNRKCLEIILFKLLYVFCLFFLFFGSSTVTITNGSNKSSGSSHREVLACSSNGGNHDQEISGKYANKLL